MLNNRHQMFEMSDNYVRLYFHPQNQGHNKSFIKEYKYMVPVYLNSDCCDESLNRIPFCGIENWKCHGEFNLK